MENNRILEIEDFSLSFSINNREVKAVDCLSLFVEKNEIVGLVGESGCGKSLTALSIMNLQPSSSKVVSGSIKLLDENVLDYDKKQWNKKRGFDFSIIFQEPMTALDPLVKIGKQISQVVIEHGGTKEEAKNKALKMMRLVELKDVDTLYNYYPHQLSGGMRQRVMIALALINNPSILIADEPTTALDVTVQKQVLTLLKEMNRKLNTAILFISHDLAVVKNLCSRLYVMYAGLIVESGSSNELMEHPLHPYTKDLIDSIPSFAKRGKPLNAIKGRVPSLEERGSTCCPFAPRCKIATDVCRNTPLKKQEKNGRFVKCHYVDLDKEV